MALETLNGVEKIGGFKINREKQGEVNAETPIGISEPNCLQFQLQDGPVKEHGVNGCQVDTIIEAAKLIVEGLNKKFPCRENSMVITKLDEALMWSAKRKADREARNVEGTSQA